MELKSQHAEEREQNRKGSNRTFMELKYENEYLDMLARKVLIAPLWN